jgi:hypothetical protein
MWIVFQVTFVKEAVFSPSCILGSFVEEQLAIDAVSSILIHWSSCLFLHQYHGHGLLAQNCLKEKLKPSTTRKN